LSGPPLLGPSVPRRGSTVLRALGRGIHALMGWRIVGEVPDLPKLVIAVAPHTSNWDFVVGAAAMFALDLRLTFIGKHTLFVGPFGWILRRMGGIPVDRSVPHGMVHQTIAAFAREPALVLAIAPEGTRRRVERFRTGFLHIAHGAGVPVVLAALDYESRCVRLGPSLDIGPDIETERARVEAHFAGVRGKRLR
jgi:1-acyl-sn-glycerol-3-phosphate acyltransferase